MFNEKAITILSMAKVINKNQQDFVEAAELGIQALVKQEPAKILGETPFGNCPDCRYEFNSELINEYVILYCPKCGQRLHD